MYFVLGTRSTSEGRPTETSQPQPPTSKSPTTDQAPDSLKKPSSTAISSSPSPPHTSTTQNRPLNSTQSHTAGKPMSAEPSSHAQISPQSHITMPSAALQQDVGMRKDEEPNMEHFAQAAENLVASLDDDEEVHVI